MYFKCHELKYLSLEKDTNITEKLVKVYWKVSTKSFCNKIYCRCISWQWGRHCGIVYWHSLVPVVLELKQIVWSIMPYLNDKASIMTCLDVFRDKSFQMLPDNLFLNLSRCQDIHVPCSLIDGALFYPTISTISIGRSRHESIAAESLFPLEDLAWPNGQNVIFNGKLKNTFLPLINIIWLIRAIK
jgi:hypothetical protein